MGASAGCGWQLGWGRALRFGLGVALTDFFELVFAGGPDVDHFDARLLGVAWGDRADDAESAGEDVDGAETGCVGLGGVGEADQAVADVLGSEDATEHVEGGQPPAVGRGVVGDFGDRAKGEVDGVGVTDEFIAVEVEVRGVAGHELGAEDFDEIVEPSEGLVVAARFGGRI